MAAKDTMAAKEAKVGQKRKVAAKGKPDAKVKKARLGDSKPAKMAPKDASRDVDDLSDSDSDDDGGVKLDESSAGKPSKQTDGAADSAVFDRGALDQGILLDPVAH